MTRYGTRYSLICGIAAGVLALAIAWPTDARAESRKGFVLGGGVGLGFASLDVPGGERQNQPGVATDITLGYAPTDQLFVYAMSRIVWFRLNDELTFTENAGLGVSYFLSPDTGSLFVTAGVGAGILVQPGSDTFETQTGLGGLVGLGYELKRNWVIEADVGYNSPGDFSSVFSMAKISYWHY